MANHFNCLKIYNCYAFVWFVRFFTYSVYFHNTPFLKCKNSWSIFVINQLFLYLICILALGWLQVKQDLDFTSKPFNNCFTCNLTKNANHISLLTFLLANLHCFHNINLYLYLYIVLLQFVHYLLTPWYYPPYTCMSVKLNPLSPLKTMLPAFLCTFAFNTLPLSTNLSVSVRDNVIFLDLSAIEHII